MCDDTAITSLRVLRVKEGEDAVRLHDPVVPDVAGWPLLKVDYFGTMGSRPHLIENALEDCVSAFDGFVRERARSFASKSADPAGAESMRFQNLPRSAARVKVLFGIDLHERIALDDWTFAHICFMQRHVLAPHGGLM